eukprot:TRINITY_DN7005_c0_g1_i1.p1 TRINITY_DN7005_c0_g1~~TRINITY_DN7005_c0_g1_i1.p1  ORF type:complete len:490 (-),score=128.41 TRINITY_DN7005_c0_g1_i1:30-1457(-)
MSFDEIKNICIVGAGYVGGPTAAVFAKYCPHIQVVVCDIDQRRIDSWKSDKLPIFEPGLQDLVSTYIGTNLHFTTDVETAIRNADVVFIAVNTPTKMYGAGVGNGYDLSAYEAVSRSIAQYVVKDTIVVEKSTVPVRTAARIRTVFDSNKTSENIHFEILSNPEFLAEGTAIRNLEYPDRVLIGGERTPSGDAAVELVSQVYRNWVPEDRIINTNLWSSELAKLAANAFLAQRVSSINSMSILCEKTGADVEEIGRVLGSDKRIGSRFLQASAGFGGSCFGKDLRGLIYLCETYHLNEIADYWRQVLLMNSHQKTRFARLIVETMFGNIKRKNICVFGFSFKKNTFDTRESAAIDVTDFLLQEGSNIFVYDPLVPDLEIKRLFPSGVEPQRDPYTAALEADAIVIMTEWDEFVDLNYQRIYNQMKKPAFIFDSRNILDHEHLRDIGFYVFVIGKGVLAPHTNTPRTLALEEQAKL